MALEIVRDFHQRRDRMQNHRIRMIVLTGKKT